MKLGFHPLHVQLRGLEGDNRSLVRGGGSLDAGDARGAEFGVTGTVRTVIAADYLLLPIVNQAAVAILASGQSFRGGRDALAGGFLVLGAVAVLLLKKRAAP